MSQPAAYLYIWAHNAHNPQNGLDTCADQGKQPDEPFDTQLGVLAAESAQSPVDLTDTSSCPVGVVCEGCREDRGLEVAVASCSVGALCLTLCTSCRRRPLPRFKLLDLLARCGQHAEHLAIDVDQMAALLDGAL